MFDRVKYMEDYYVNNKIEMNLNSRKYNLKNKDYMKNYRINNKCRIKKYNREYKKEYYANNKDKINEEKKERRIRLRILKPILYKPYKSHGKEYSENWYRLRKEIYKRDGWICKECDIHCTTKGKTKIQCHHIDYNVNNNDSKNLITLCASCHMKTNFKRENWTNYFKVRENK